MRFNHNQFSPWKIEAYKKGVVAYSKSNDDKTEAILFCDSKKRITFQLKTPMVGEASSYDWMNDSISQIELFGQTLDSNSFSFKAESGAFTFSAYFSHLDEKSFSKENVIISSEDSNVASSTLESYKLTDRDLLLNAKVALKNCI